MSRDAWIGLLLILLTFSAVGNIVQFWFSVVKEQPESVQTDYKGFYAFHLSYSEKDCWVQAVTRKDGYHDEFPFSNHLNLDHVISFNAEWNFTMWERAKFAV